MTDTLHPVVTEGRCRVCGLKSGRDVHPWCRDPRPMQRALDRLPRPYRAKRDSVEPGRQGDDLVSLKDVLS